MMWILTPGLVEETAKGMWLFFRLRRSTSQLPGRCCFGLFRAFHHNDCGCWYKLAPTPYHVLLSALAAGAGFECLENVKFVFVDSHALPRLSAGNSNMLSMAVARCVSSGLHMVWTGLLGYGLARRLFLPEEQRWSLIAVLLPSIVLHGLYDYTTSAMAWVNLSRKVGMLSDEAAASDAGFLFFLMVASSLGSCCILAQLTGLRCCRPKRAGGGRSERHCCCYDGFWEERFEMEAPMPSASPLLVGFAARTSPSTSEADEECAQERDVPLRLEGMEV